MGYKTKRARLTIELEIEVREDYDLTELSAFNVEIGLNLARPPKIIAESYKIEDEDNKIISGRLR